MLFVGCIPLGKLLILGLVRYCFSLNPEFLDLNDKLVEDFQNQGEKRSSYLIPMARENNFKVLPLKSKGMRNNFMILTKVKKEVSNSSHKLMKR
jgi:hypothetical protein